MVNSMRLAVAAVAVHSILFVSIFDIYFTSPIERGMEPQYYSLPPPAKRLVLFVADGLRADTIFSLNEDGSSPAPFIRNVIESSGRWGVSHTHVPTESRPGHVALIAGFYEDVSAVTRGWQENPVQFDSVFNQSHHTWSWGSPDILPMFSQGAVPGRVDAFMYDAAWEDFADSDASKLDTWVFEKVEELFSRAKSDDALAETLLEEKVVFFLHLLGIDTNGHAHRPTSKEVLDNLRVVDEGVKRISEIINSFYGDDKTAYVLTSDHGMTDWGSHGAGLDTETMTPLVCWGAGIKNPVSSAYASKAYHDGFSEKWGLEKFERIDVEQADIAPLMSTLIGGAIPLNSEGVLPIRFLHYNKAFSSQSIFANLRQLVEQLRVKEERIYQTSLPFKFTPFSKKSSSEFKSDIAQIDKLVNTNQHQQAIELSYKLIEICRDGVRYYHTYHRFWLYIVLTIGFIGWILCTLLTILQESMQKLAPFQSRNSVSKPPLWPFVLLVVTSILLFYQSSPILYYLYYTLPIACWSYLWTHKAVVSRSWQLAKQNPSVLFKSLGAVIFVGCGLELLVLSFFFREVLSVMLILLSIWPFLTELGAKKLKLSLAWLITCVLLAIFPLLPVVGRNAKYIFVTFSGLFAVAVCIYLFLNPQLQYLLCTPDSGSLKPKYLFRFQIVLLGVSSFVPIITNWFFAQKESIPLFLHLFSWTTLVISVAAIHFGPKGLPGRLLYIALSCYTVFVLLSTSFEAVFILLLCIILYLWISAEEGLAPKHSKASTFWEGLIAFRPPKVVTLMPGDRQQKEYQLTTDDVRRVFFCLFLGILTFFGTGNIASVNTFDPATVYCFLTVFSPFVMGALILWKMVIPFVFVSCAFNVIVSLLNRSLKHGLLLMLIMSDILALNFFFLVRDYGSWLEIGVSISHYVIMMSMSIGTVLLVGVARLLTGITVVSRKIEDHL